MAQAEPVIGIAAGLLATALAGCIAGGVDGLRTSGEDGPLAVGATWTLGGDSHGTSYRQTAVVTDLVERRGEPAYQVEAVTRYAAERGVQHFHTQWLRASDLALLEDQGSVHGVLDNGIAIDDRSRTIYDPPCPDVYGRPLEVGLQWRHECTGVSDRTDWSSSRGYSSWSSNRSHWSTLRVEAVEEVSVPAGTFQAYRIAVTRPGEDEDVTTTAWVSEQACGASRHPVVRSAGVDHHDETGVAELIEHDCTGPVKVPWKGEGPRRWKPPVTLATEGWPDAFVPTVEELGGKLALMPVGRWGDGRPESNPTLTQNEGNGYDDTAAVETYTVIYEVKGNPADTLRFIADRFTNESYALQFSRYPIHEVPERCDADGMAMVVAGTVVVRLWASHYPYDNKDTGGLVAKALADSVALLEDRFGVEAQACEWRPPAETPPSWTTTSSGP